MNPRSWFVLGSLVVALAAGCNKVPPKPAVTPVRGTVTLKGQPVCLGTLELTPLPGGGAECRSEIGKDGSFALRTQAGLPEPDGAVPGKYKVVVTTGQPTKDATPTKIPRKYTDLSTTDKVVEIKSGETNLTIDLQ